VARVFQTLAIEMAYDGRALTILYPISAGGVATSRSEQALRIGAGQNVMHVDGIATAADHLSFFGQGRLLVDVI